MKKICFIIPDGTGIRNYMFSNLIKELKNSQAKIVLLHSISDNAIKEINEVQKENFEAYKLPIYKESYYQKFLREIVCCSRLIYNSKLVDNNTILTNWKPNKRDLKNRFFYKLVELIGKRISKKYDTILYFERKYDESLFKSTSDCKRILSEIQPDVIFSTHQRAMSAVPIISAAHQLNIKTVGTIFSWDNLPKARLTVRTNDYIVWSNYMKNELQSFYPEISKGSVTVTGTPQFEFYYNTDFIQSKEEFYKKNSLDPSKKIICFSGDDELTSPFDPSYLEDLASVIKEEKLNIQIVLRRAPVDVSGRFNNVMAKFPSIIKEIEPLWNFDKNDKKNWQVIYPTYNDVELLINTVFHCDAVINVGSTMAHDFAMFNKPAIYINYDKINTKNWSVNMIYKYQHFRSMNGLKPVYWLNSKNEIHSLLSSIFDVQLLDNIKWLDIIAEQRKEASLNIAKKLISCT